MARYRKTLKVKDARIEIEIEASPFDPRKHRYRHNAAGDVEMDGFPALGTDSIPPRAHNMVTRLEVRWNGRRVPIPQRAWRYMLNTPLTDDEIVDDGNIRALASDDGSALLLSLGGGDAAGSFDRWWVIRRDGVAAVFTRGPE